MGTKIQNQIKQSRENKLVVLYIISIDLTLWITYFTAVFESDYGKAVIFVTSIVFTIVIIYVAVKTYQAYHVKEENLDIENLIRDIEKRTE